MTPEDFERSYLADVPEPNRHMLVGEAGACFELIEGRRRVVLAIGREPPTKDGTRSPLHGIFLREEPLTCLRTALMAHSLIVPRPGSHVYRLPTDWCEADSDNADSDGDDVARKEWLDSLLRPLDRSWAITASHFAAVGFGKAMDDRKWYAAIVGTDKATGERCAHFIEAEWLDNIWRSLLDGPGGFFHTSDSIYGELFGAPDAFAREADDEAET